ncbi:MAG: preprotein translocase subunit SecY [Candidatus Aenigmatarchaeota archaeon]
MSLLDNIARFLPSVETPKHFVSFKRRMLWTGIILFLFLLMGYISLYGISERTYERFTFLEMILGSSMGSIISLGIGPIVTASIILQLLVGAKLLPLDLTKKEDRERFQSLQKILTIVFCFLEGSAYVIFGVIQPTQPTLENILLVTLQLAFGGFIILLMDEVVSKWGIGSGVSLFIAAGVSRSIFIRIFNPFSFGGEYPAGLIPQAIIAIGRGEMEIAIDALLPVFATILVFLIVVYAQGIEVEIPLAFGALSGFGKRWPLKFIYTSNIPIILTSALLANLMLIGSMTASKGIPILGEFDENNNPISGILYYLSPPRNLALSLIHGTFTIDMIFRALVYTIFICIFATIFSVLWVQTSGMDARSVAEQIQSIGMQIPGFRRDPRIIEEVLARYINTLAILGGLFVGLLASFADLTGAVGSGTGILLTVMIIYNFYEQISLRYMEEMHPMLRSLFE